MSSYAVTGSTVTKNGVTVDAHRSFRGSTRVNPLFEAFLAKLKEDYPNIGVVDNIWYQVCDDCVYSTRHAESSGNCTIARNLQAFVTNGMSDDKAVFFTQVSDKPVFNVEKVTPSEVVVCDSATRITAHPLDFAHMLQGKLIHHHQHACTHDARKGMRYDKRTDIATYADMTRYLEGCGDDPSILTSEILFRQEPLARHVDLDAVLIDRNTEKVVAVFEEYIGPNGSKSTRYSQTMAGSLDAHFIHARTIDPSLSLDAEGSCDIRVHRPNSMGGPGKTLLTVRSYRAFLDGWCAANLRMHTSPVR